jgi:hypothetical protein
MPQYDLYGAGTLASPSSLRTTCTRRASSRTGQRYEPLCVSLPPSLSLSLSLSVSVAVAAAVSVSVCLCRCRCLCLQLSLTLFSRCAKCEGQAVWRDGDDYYLLGSHLTGWSANPAILSHAKGFSPSLSVSVSVSVSVSLSLTVCVQVHFATGQPGLCWVSSPHAIYGSLSVENLHAHICVNTTYTLYGAVECVCISL